MYLSDKKKPTLSIHTHWQVAQSRPSRQNLPKSMAASTHGRKEKIKHGHTTIPIRNAGESADMKVITFNKLSAKRTVKCLEIPHYA